MAGCRTLKQAVADSCGLLMEGGIKRCIKRVARVGCSGRSTVARGGPIAVYGRGKNGVRVAEADIHPRGALPDAVYGRHKSGKRCRGFYPPRTQHTLATRGIGCSGRSTPPWGGLRLSTARQERVSMLQSSIYAVEVCYSNPKNLRHQLERRCAPVSRSTWLVGASTPSGSSATVSGPCGASRRFPGSNSGTRWVKDIMM